MNLMTNPRSKLFCALKQCVKMRRFSNNFPKASLLQISPEVQQAVHDQKPIVALESAIITHGMPFPENLKTATSLERIVKENGAIPATVAVIKGQICVGLETHQLDQLAQTKHATKISTRDFPYAAIKRLTGGTTVAATLFAAHSAARAITVMATGGIGGVHFDGQNSMDVSADLVEIGRTPMAIVSSGIKSILDLDRTLEYMETLGIGLASFNNSQHLPGFFSEKSGRMAPYDVSSALEAANILNEWLNLKLTAGLLFAVPVPKEHSIDEELIKNIIKEANDKAKETGLIGKDLTPFLLDRIVTKTSKKSLRTNVALVETNAKIASQIAVEHCRIKSNTRCQSQSANSSNSSTFFIKSDVNSTRNCLNSPVVIGGSNVDFLVKMIRDDVQPGGATNPGRITRTYGGVGRNLAEGLARLGLKPIFISAVGQDSLGKELMASVPVLNHSGFLRCLNNRTATYCVVFKNSGDVYLGVGDMSVHESISPKHVENFVEDLKRAPIVIIDGNTPVETIEVVLDICAKNNTAVWYEPTDVNRAAKPFLTDRWRSLSYASPNLEELRRMHAALFKDEKVLNNRQNTQDELEPLIEEVMALSKPLLEHIHCLVVTMGHHGLVVLRNEDFQTPFPIHYIKGRKLSAVHYEAPAVPVINVSGSGDSLAATMIAGILTGRSPDECVQAGLQAAALSLQSELTISETISYKSMFSGAFQSILSRVIHF